jgi:hypothetical protein
MDRQHVFAVSTSIGFLVTSAEAFCTYLWPVAQLQLPENNI